MGDVAQLTEEKVKELIYKTYLIDVTAIKNLSDIAVQLQAGSLTVPGNLTIKGELTTDEVLQVMVKEMWFFDRKRSVLDVRIIGLCPIRVYFEPEDERKENVQKKKLFWVKFPEARPFLASQEVFNAHNDVEMRSFDEIFFKRFFHGFIVQESNVYNNRVIGDYTLGVESLREAERIENLIFQFEHDLWEY